MTFDDQPKTFETFMIQDLSVLRFEVIQIYHQTCNTDSKYPLTSRSQTANA